MLDVSAPRVVIVGGGPGGYEAALVAAQLGANVTVVDRDGIGGSAVLTDCVPSKTLIATAEAMLTVEHADDFGVVVPRGARVDLGLANARVKKLALAQSADISARLAKDGVDVIPGTAELESPERVAVTTTAGERTTLAADMVLVATGAHPRVLPDAVPDGERILTWTQVYELTELPERLIVVGSGVTGAEFAGAYQALGSQVVLVSSRDRVLPSEDTDAAAVIEVAFTRSGMEVMSRSRAASVRRNGDGVLVTLTDGRVVEGSHCLLAVGSIPNTVGIGLEAAGVACDDHGFVTVDRVSRTTARGVYAAGDCTGVNMLASVAAMQGRIAMWHQLGDAVMPLGLRAVSANVFTQPEIATVGWQETDLAAEGMRAVSVLLPLPGNPRAKMLDIHEGFVKLFARQGSGTVLGGVVVSPRASELIHAVSLAVSHKLTVDQVASTFTVYPSLSGSTAEAARQLHTAVQG
jgi:pyruvate/2-oxoglutarate dehydrogenase complex dihydrolipoamide dehydrogenase (E3) component